MNRTFLARQPVLTFFCSSPALSERCQTVLHRLLGLEPVKLTEGIVGDALDQELNSKFSTWSKRWVSVAAKCKSSETIIHFVALDQKSNRRSEPSLALLAIADNESGSDEEAVASSRQLIASRLSSFAQRSSIVLRHTFGQSIGTNSILGYGGGLPLLQLRETTSTVAPRNGLREVTIPHFDDARYPNEETLLQTLSSSKMPRPVLGLYQLSNGVALRPLPTANEDRQLSQLALVYHDNDWDQMEDRCQEENATAAKIGFNGMTRNGQIMIAHEDLPGINIRLTGAEEFSSSFAEAQDALLAASLSELQSVNVLKEGGGNEESSSDSKTNVADCWVEFRATVAKPSGFVKRGGNQKRTKLRTANVPDLPYE